MKALRPLLAALVLAASSGAAICDPDAPALRVHLPRAVSVDGERLSLGMISVVRADDDAVAGKAAAIAMGRAPWSKETLAIDRTTILGRLAANGLPRSEVRFSGAEQVVITRNEEVVASDRIVKAAEAFLGKMRPAPAGSNWRLLRCSGDVCVPAGSRVALEPRMAKHGVDREAVVEVVAKSDDRMLTVSTVVFRMAYRQRQLVATADIPAGGVVTPENTDIRSVTGDYPEPADWAAPYGQRAARLIPVGSVVRTGLVRPATTEVLVRRNDTVLMRITGTLFQITALGEALENGGEGDLIKVRNVDSKRIVVARVIHDGTVQPVCGER
ncbi:MAG: hypothetical protein AMS14_02625 [Planctomycetes bacterium DG_20]|nr:MAG: hypothetical protein AMS14_02625 [Planctomycetes bacterium DG_20]